jgi:type I restriction enzyme M protein
MAEDIETIRQKTKDLIDRLKAITNSKGMGNGGNEYTVIVQAFLYKYLNDKFIHEARIIRPELQATEDVMSVFDAMTDKDYDMMCDMMEDTIELRKEHLIQYVASRQNDSNFAELFDNTFNDIATINEEVFFVQNADGTRVPILRPLSELVTGGNDKKNEFCKAIVGALADFSFEDTFAMGYDFFSTIFEYLIQDYNANGGGTYAEYYTPHAVAMIMAQLLVSPDEHVQNVTCYDPAAGTGTLIIALSNIIGSKKCSVYTQDISEKSSTMMMLNLILNEQSHSLANVIQGNTLTTPYHKNPDGTLRKFDYIVSNPPFKLDFSDDHDKLKNDSYKGRYFAGIPNIPNKDKKSMEIYLCFFQHIIYSLNETGKAAIVVPTGFLTAKSGIAFKVRKHLVDQKMLRGVVSMPSNIFANTGTNVSVVFLDKTNKEGNVILVDASKLGTTVKDGKNQKTLLSDEDISKIVGTFRECKPVDDFSVSVSYEEIAEKNCVFSAGQYFDIKIEYVDITEEEFKKRMNDYQSQLNEMFEEGRKLEEEIKNKMDQLIISKVGDE